MQTFNLFITGHKGFETLLFHELRELLGEDGPRPRKRYGGVAIEGGIDDIYRLCLHSRLANRVFCELGKARVADETQLYEAIASIDWSNHFGPSNSIAVSATLSRSALTHAHYAALKVKDAIVDQFRARTGERPSVAKQRPDIQLHLNIHQNQATISLDLSGESLHRRGYRLQHAGAPLKEHLAAALLLQAGWDARKTLPARLVDPMCGSGTFAIEAAMLAADMAPQLQRKYFGFVGWRAHQPERWQACREAALAAVREQVEVEIIAADYDRGALRIARENAARAGVEHLIRFEHQQVSDLELPTIEETSLVICNPPYGQRLEAQAGIGQLYADLGAFVQRLAPARLALISANPDQLHRLQLQPAERKSVRNGPLDCVFAEYVTDAPQQITSEPMQVAAVDDPAATPLRNRLQKNARHLERWARRNGISCYRLYDADLPEFAFSLERYGSDIDPALEWFHLQEYRAPASVDPTVAEQRIELARRVVSEVFSVAPERLFCKTRQRQRGDAQYRKQDNRGELYQVREGPAALLVNLSDYLDTGLFLDHRLTRERVLREAKGKRVLNLFCYTASVGVMAALGGATKVVNVDLSANYLDWARENFRINGLDDEDRYRFQRADVQELLRHPADFDLGEAFDLVFLDPPSFSNSSRMAQTLDLQRDHAELIRQSMALLADDGLLLFSTNRRGFRLADEVDDAFAVQDITRATVSEDFKRNPKMHLCWEIRQRSDAT